MSHVHARPGDGFRARGCWRGVLMEQSMRSGGREVNHRFNLLRYDAACCHAARATGHGDQLR